MKRVLIVLAAISICLAACQSQNRSNTKFRSAVNTSTPAFSTFIPMDSANKMISSYLNSVKDSDSSLQSLVINVAQLLSYINQADSTDSIVGIKLCFAHTLEYINSGHGNQYAGYKSRALTLIVAGYDANGNYVYFNGSNVLEHMAPCPYNCPPGTAANALLSQ